MRILKLKKYSNRKIYAGKNSGLGKSTYVNLKEISDFIKQGYGLQVTDDTNGADITNKVLKEIITLDAVSIENFQLFDAIRG